MVNDSIYGYISSAVVDGMLPEGFSLSRYYGDADEIQWADGATDGTCIYHMRPKDLSQEEVALIAQAVQVAAGGELSDAESLFSNLGQEIRACTAIRDLHQYVVKHSDELNGGNLLEAGLYLAMDSTDTECVKYGISILGLFNTDGNEVLKDVVRILGLCDEFTIFSLSVMSGWENGNDEIWNLARKVHGWGRIHAVDFISSSSDEVRHWLLTDGVHNDIMAAYSALTCWEKADVREKLRGELSIEEFQGIRDIISGLFDEGPVAGISAIAECDDSIKMFLEHARKLAAVVADYEVVREIADYYEETDNEISDLCRNILTSDSCRRTVSDAVKEGQGIELAQDLGIDCRDIILNLIKDDLENRSYLSSRIMADPEYRGKVLDVYRDKLPLSKMIPNPINSSGQIEFWRLNAYEMLLQDLRRFPGEGQDFVLTALQCTPISLVNSGLFVIEYWVSRKGAPLKECLPDFYDKVYSLRKTHRIGNLQDRLDPILEGSTEFNNIIKDW